MSVALAVVCLSVLTSKSLHFLLYSLKATIAGLKATIATASVVSNEGKIH